MSRLDRSPPPSSMSSASIPRNWRAREWRIARYCRGSESKTYGEPSEASAAGRSENRWKRGCNWKRVLRLDLEQEPKGSVCRQVVAGPRNHRYSGDHVAEALGSSTRTWPLLGPHETYYGVPQVRKGLLALIPLASEGRGRNLHRPSDPPPALAHSSSATEI